jgi:tryptophan-rich sensory protein
MSLVLSNNKPGVKPWQLAFISLGLSFLGKLAGETNEKDRKVYTQKFRQAPWSPPPWVFGPAWTAINFFLVRSIKRILEKNIPDKKKLLVLQAAIWTIFFSFNYIYFKKKSPVLATAWTMADNALAIASFLIAFKNDKKTALHYLPLLLWTSFAATLSGYQALYNKDPYLKTKPLIAYIK